MPVKGTSMNRVAPPGSVIIVDYNDKALIDRKRYLIRRGDEITFKLYRNSGGPERFEPETTDAGHETIFADAETEIIGRVVRVYQEI